MAEGVRLHFHLQLALLSLEMLVILRGTILILHFTFLKMVFLSETMGHREVQTRICALLKYVNWLVRKNTLNWQIIRHSNL